MAQDDGQTDASQGHDAYTRLLSEIRQGRLAPGDRLTETDLAARLGTSRTPVREAIRLLQSDGLVTHTPRVGAVIRELDYAEITELYEMRAVLEGTAARFAARAAYPSEIDEMEALNAEMAAATGDVERLCQANWQFHDILRRAARNRFLLHAVEAAQKTLLILGPSTMEEGSRAEAAVAEHARLIEALRARDEEEAEARMRAHMDAAHRARQRQLRKAGGR
jgi:DNA-binding GntR family transcriptional regulator